MRPPEFTGGNPVQHVHHVVVAEASMRPPEFTGGNLAIRVLGNGGERVASMRPPEFTGGNTLSRSAVGRPHALLQ